MNYKFPILTLVAGIGATLAAWQFFGERGPVRAAPRPSTQPTAIIGPGLASTDGNAGSLPTAEALIDAAQAALARHRSIKANLSQEVDQFGQRMFGSGRYLQGPAHTHQMRLELKVRFTDQISIFWQVSDGEDLWIYRHLLGSPFLRRVDIRRLEQIDRERAAQEEAPGYGLLPVCGLTAVLDALERSFDFETVPTTEAEPAEHYELRGRWKQARLKEFLPQQVEAILAGEEPDLGKLPEQIPDEVALYLGRDDLFPYRIEYYRFAPVPDVGQGKVAKKTTPVVSIVFYDVAFDVPLDPKTFTYEPGDMEPGDVTYQYSVKLGLTEPASP